MYYAGKDRQRERAGYVARAAALYIENSLYGPSSRGAQSSLSAAAGGANNKQSDSQLIHLAGLPRRLCLLISYLVVTLVEAISRGLCCLRGLCVSVCVCGG